MFISQMTLACIIAEQFWGDMQRNNLQKYKEGFWGWILEFRKMGCDTVHYKRLIRAYYSNDIAIRN